jgi:hypothetical protein
MAFLDPSRPALGLPPPLRIHNKRLHNGSMELKNSIREGAENAVKR